MNLEKTEVTFEVSGVSLSATSAPLFLSGTIGLFDTLTPFKTSKGLLQHAKRNLLRALRTIPRQTNASISARTTTRLENGGEELRIRPIYVIERSTQGQTVNWQYRELDPDSPDLSREFATLEEAVLEAVQTLPQYKEALSLTSTAKKLSRLREQLAKEEEEIRAIQKHTDELNALADASVSKEEPQDKSPNPANNGSDRYNEWDQ